MTYQGKVYRTAEALFQALRFEAIPEKWDEAEVAQNEIRSANEARTAS